MKAFTPAAGASVGPILLPFNGPDIGKVMVTVLVQVQLKKTKMKMKEQEGKEARDMSTVLSLEYYERNR